MIAGDAELPRRSSGGIDAALDAPATPAGRRWPGRHIAAHWRGELPLPLSFWIHGALIGLLCSLAAGALLTRIDITDAPLRWPALAALFGWPLLLAIQAWGFVGAWRSAGAANRDGRSAVWVHGCRLAVAAGAAGALLSTGLHFLPRVPEFIRIVLGTDPRGQVMATRSADGHRLRLKGWLGIGDGARVRQLIAGAPQVRLLELDSPGGRFDEALALADALRGQGWTIRVRGTCRDACTLVFMAGQVRQLLPGAEWSVHRPPAAVFNPLFTQIAKRELAARYRQAGLPDSLVKMSLAMPPAHRWTSTWGELAAAGIVSTPPYPLDIDVPRRRDTPTTELVEALHTNPTWHALERRFPGSIAEAAQRMQAARERGATDEVALLMAQGVVEDLLPQLLFNASPPLREQYVALLAQQIQAARDGGLARFAASLLKGDSAARRALPVALAVRESVWLADAAAEPVRQAPARQANTIELEVVRRTLGADAPALLAGLRRAGEANGRQVDRIAALLSEVQRLPHAERRLAIRLMFERP